MFDQTRYNPPNKLIAYLQAKGEVIEVANQECVVNIGEKSDKVFLILSGGFVCQCYDLNTERLRTINFHLDTFHPLMTVLTSYYKDVVSDCQLKAFKKSKVILIKKKNILRALEEDSELKELYVEETIWALVAINEFHSKLITLDSKSMYSYMVKECSEVVKKIPSKYIAEFMGVTPEWLSKLKQKF